jgi:hypothetical protein
MFPSVILVTFEPQTRLSHLEGYVKYIHLNLPLEEALVQALRCRLVAYKLVAEIGESGFDKDYVDRLMAEVYKNLSLVAGRAVFDPYLDPCRGQYEVLQELKTYVHRDKKEPFMVFIKAEFKKVFVPTLYLLTLLCRSEKKYPWEEVKSQLGDIMQELGVDSSWNECEEYMRKYTSKVSGVLRLKA